MVLTTPPSERTGSLQVWILIPLETKVLWPADAPMVHSENTRSCADGNLGCTTYKFGASN